MTAEHAEADQARSALDELDRWLLNQVQFDFPLEQRPWQAIAARHDDLGERDVLERITGLKQRGLIRQISAIFDTTALGYQSTLVAARVPEDRLDDAAAVVSRHEGVSHNYRREAEFNLWFTLAVPPGEDLAAALEQLGRDAGFEDVLPLPTQRTFRIGVKLDLTGEGDSAPHRPASPRHAGAPPELTDADRQLIRLTQEDLPLLAQPFTPICAEADVSFSELQAWLQRMQDQGVMRRFAAILRHRRAGFVANGMGVWQVPEDRIEQAGRIVADDFAEVSHCYQRPSYDRWPYNLYTMIHARSREECEAVAQRIAQRLAPLGVAPPRLLYSTTEYKKARLRYFTTTPA